MPLSSAAGANLNPGHFPGKVALLTNFLPPYRIPVLELLQSSVAQLRIFLSVAMEKNRQWAPHWGSLDVTIQHGISFSGRVTDPGRYTERTAVHFPYDTLWQLFRYRPDAVIVAEFGMRTAQAALYKLIHPRTKLIVWATLSEHTESTRGAIRVGLRRIILRTADAVLVNGSSGKRYIEAFGFPSRRIHVVPQASDNDAFLGPAVRPPHPVRKVLYVGQLIERKGLKEFCGQLVRWCEENPGSRVCWTLVGSGPLRASIASWQVPLNCTIQVVADVPFAEIAPHYRGADLFTLPSLADEWGLVVNEALIAGLPVLGSVYSQAVEDLVVDGVNGWTFRPDCESSMRAAMDAALSCSPDQLNAMRANAIESVRSLDFLFMKDQILRALHAVKAEGA